MLEILAIIFLTRRVGEIVEEKGRKTIGYKVLTVALWIGGEIIFAIVGAIIVALSGLPELAIYGFALAGAAIGGGTAYMIAKLVPPTENAPPPLPPTFSSGSILPR